MIYTVGTSYIGGPRGPTRHAQFFGTISLAGTPLQNVHDADKGHLESNIHLGNRRKIGQQ